MSDTQPPVRSLYLLLLCAYACGFACGAAFLAAMLLS
jgi:hypothetical protein